LIWWDWFSSRGRIEATLWSDLERPIEGFMWQDFPSGKKASPSCQKSLKALNPDFRKAVAYFAPAFLSVKSQSVCSLSHKISNYLL